MTNNGSGPEPAGTGSTERGISGGSPVIESRLSTVLAVVRATTRQEYYRRTTTRRKQALLLVGFVAFLPVVGLFLLGAYNAGQVARAADSTALLSIARWLLPGILGLTAANGALLFTDDLLEFDAKRLLLTTVPDRTLVLALLCTTFGQASVLLGIPLLALFVAFGAGAGSVLAGLGGYLAAVCLLLAGSLLGAVLGIAGRRALYSVPLSADARQLYGTIGKVVFFVGLGGVGAVAGSALGDSAIESVGLTAIAPEGPPPVPVGYAADWLFYATPLVDGVGLEALASGTVVLASIPLSVAGLVRLTPTLWYNEPNEPADSSEKSVVDRPTLLRGGRAPTTRRLGVVVDGLLRRARRRPQRFAFLAYHLFVPMTMGAGLLVGGSFSVPTVVGGAVVMLGLWFAGATFCLNPLGEEGPMLGQLVLSLTLARTVIGARVVAGTLVGLPFVVVGTVLIGFDAPSAFETTILGAYWLWLVPVSAGSALGIGALLPSTETRELLDAVEVRAPELLAVIYHGVLVSLLTIGGLILVVASLDDIQRVGGAVVLGAAGLTAGHGGYRFAVGKLADHGRTRRSDSVFAVELVSGIVLAGFGLSQSASLGVGVLTESEGFAAFVSQFLGGYVGWATVLVAYLIVSRRRDYLDISLPTLRDLRLTAVVTVAVLGLWIVTTVAVETFGLPFAEHTLGSAADRRREVAVVVALLFLVNAPVEEALFRNVIQKRLAETLDTRTAIAGATLVFGLVHVPAYITGGVAGAVVPLTLVTVAGWGFALVYERTESLIPAVICHGTYNAVQVVAVAFLL